MSSQVVPLSSQPQQLFKVQLQVDGNPLTLILEINWSYMAGYWTITISDAGNNLLLDSIPLITGWYPAANILGQWQYLNIGSAYILNLGNSTSDYPGIDDLGTNWALLWGDTYEEVTLP